MEVVLGNTLWALAALCHNPGNEWAEGCGRGGRGASRRGWSKGLACGKWQ